MRKKLLDGRWCGCWLWCVRWCGCGISCRGRGGLWPILYVPAGAFSFVEAVVGGTGLEPVTSCVSSKYSNQLS